MRVWSILNGESASIEERMDMEYAMSHSHLSESDRSFVVKLSHGYTVSEAMHLANVSANQTRYKESVLRQLVEGMNNSGKESSDHGFGPHRKNHSSQTP